MPAILDNAIVTEVPGPMTKAMSKKLDTIFDSRAVHFVVDYEKSKGN
jgi:4-aminobutyrate aminotransferase / (S)-3-amino-2-methylpropionate transaminase